MAQNYNNGYNGNFQSQNPRNFQNQAQNGYGNFQQNGNFRSNGGFQQQNRNGNNGQNRQQGNRQSYNVCTDFGLRCNTIKQTQTGALVLNCMFRSKKREDGTYPRTPFISVYCNPAECQMDMMADYNGQAITVSGQLSASSYIDKNGVEVPALTIFATSVRLSFPNSGNQQGGYGNRQPNGNYQQNGNWNQPPMQGQQGQRNFNFQNPPQQNMNFAPMQGQGNFQNQSPQNLAQMNGNAPQPQQNGYQNQPVQNDAPVVQGQNAQSDMNQQNPQSDGLSEFENILNDEIVPF